MTYDIPLQRGGHLRIPLQRGHPPLPLRRGDHPAIRVWRTEFAPPKLAFNSPRHSQYVGIA